MWRHSVRVEIGGKEKNLLLTGHPSQGQQTPFFSKPFSTSLSSMLSLRSLEHVWLKIIWLKSSHNREIVKSLFGSHLSDRITSRKRDMAAEYCSNWRQYCSNLETHFTRKTCTLEAETSVSG